MYTSSIQSLKPVVSYLETNHVRILGENLSVATSIVLLLTMPSGEQRDLAINYEFLRQYSAEQIRGYLEKYDFVRKLEGSSQHISKL